jgi:hypothetical protein
MPADRRTRSILVDERHRKRFGIDTSPPRNRGTQRQQEVRERACRLAVVRLTEKRHAPPRDDATHFEVRERDVGDGI